MTATALRGITNAELARRLRKPTSLTLEILRDLEASGIAERAAGRWRLTERGRREFGGLARMPLHTDDGEEG